MILCLFAAKLFILGVEIRIINVSIMAVNISKVQGVPNSSIESKHNYRVSGKIVSSSTMSMSRKFLCMLNQMIKSIVLMWSKTTFVLQQYVWLKTINRLYNSHAVKFIHNCFSVIVIHKDVSWQLIYDTENVCVSGDRLLLNSTNFVKHTQQPL